MFSFGQSSGIQFISSNFYIGFEPNTVQTKTTTKKRKPATFADDSGTRMLKWR